MKPLPRGRGIFALSGPVMPRFHVPVLMFHHVDDLPAGGPPPLHPNSYVGRAEFASILDTLALAGATPLTLAGAVEAFTRGRLPKRSVVLTFDDGCRCFLDHALPALAARGMTATLFAVAGELGGTNRWDTPAGEREERLLDAQGLRQVAAAGFEVGSHGLHHRDLTATPDGAELAGEAAGSRAALEAALGRPVATFCYPYGRVDARAREAVAAAGYQAAVSIRGQAGARAGDLFSLPREIVNPGDSAFELQLKARGLYPLWSRLPRLGILKALRRRAAA